MRTVYLVDHDFPPAQDDLDAASVAGATEVICGIPAELADRGIQTFGYHEVEDAPARRLIPKPVLLERVRAEGGDLLSDVYAIMYAATDQARDALTRWNMPGYPNVYFDDADTLGVLTLAGASEEQKARITAPA